MVFGVGLRERTLRAGLKGAFRGMVDSRAARKWNVSGSSLVYLLARIQDIERVGEGDWRDIRRFPNLLIRLRMSG
jgi:hypothetical protein